MTTSDRRLEARPSLVLKVEYPTMDGFLQDYTANISRGGTMIYTRRDVAEGQELQLVISFPGLLRPIRLMGVVRWVQPHGDGESAFGVEFRRDDESGWDQLAGVVDRIADGDARLVAEQTRRVLLVEDNQHVAHLIRRGLESHVWRCGGAIAFDLQHCSNGAEALSLIQAEPFDMLLVDVLLPLVSGDELVRRVRAEPRWQQLPIVAFSAGDETMRARALSAGADFFLPKPLRLRELLDTMNALVQASAVE
jgi:uncharacterized protein (TIGR02266 family)